jgi:DNA-directed RNA polymerase specialized sigma subunit
MRNVNLSQYRDIKREIAHIEEQLKELENKLIGPRASIITDMPTTPTYSNDQIVNGLIKLEELKERYKRMLNRLYEQQIEIEKMIECLEPLERDLIRYRYIDGMPWRKVFDKIGYSQKQTFRIHKKILQKLEKMTHTGT